MNENTINADMTMGGPDGALLAGRYRVVKQLGQGGMGSVWLAEDTALDNRQVAIKMLPSVLLSNERAYRQIKSEALLSLKLIHSNIAPIRSFEENNGNPFLVEDYIRGKNLDACLAEWGTLSEEETIALLKPVAEAIDYAHSAKVVHRDIKPANIMIREDGTPFVFDFGIAREMQETMTKVTGKLSSGTLMYMSPEQLKGAAPAPSQDVYSFAAMAYECLCGHPPFHRGQIEYQIVNETPEPLPFDSALSRKIMSALSKSPDERPDSCFSVLDVALSTAKKEDADEKATASVAKSSVDKQKQSTVKIFRKPFIWAVAFLIGLLVIALLEKVGDAKVPATRDARTESIIADKETAEKIRKDNAKEAIRLCEGGEWDAAFELSLKSDRSDQVLQYWIGCMYADGQGVAKDDAEAVKWFRKAAEQGEAEAQNRLGLMYRSGKGVAKDEAEAAKWYRKAAEQGLVGAQINLGWTYAKGRGVVKDDAEAAKWFRRAAEQGDAAIQNWLGRMYEEGNGVAKNEVEAVRWYRMAAEQGDVNAQFNMGRMCVNGRGVEKDDREAVKWFRKVAEKGDAGGQNWLGAMYKNGWGVAKDESEAVKWYRKAAEQGLANGQFNLGTCYLEGCGIAKDETEAVRWYRKAAEGGDAYAQCRLPG